MSGSNDNLAVASGSTTTVPEDPFEVFFSALPDPRSDYVHYGNSPRVPSAFKALVQAVLERPCERPEYQKLAENIIRAVRPRGGRQMTLELALARLMEFAVAVPPSHDDTSPRAAHLRYLRRIAQGRKDEHSPSATAEQRRNPADHSLLPEFAADEKICATCSATGALLHCNRCVVRTEGRVTLATFYCDERCRRSHLASHKNSCDTMVRFQRAVSLFAELFRMIHPASQDPRGFPEEISRDQYGMIRVELPNAAQCISLAFRGAHCLGPVPRKDHWDSELFETVMLRDSGNEVSRAMRPLVDLFFHPFVDNLKVIHVFPKNMAEAIYEIKPDYLLFRTAGQHTVMGMTLADGTEVAVDLAGAQYGWKEIMAPWGRYCRHRVAGGAGAPPHVEEIRPPPRSPQPRNDPGALWRGIFDRRPGRGGPSTTRAAQDPTDEQEGAGTFLTGFITIVLHEQITNEFPGGGMKEMLLGPEELGKEDNDGDGASAFHNAREMVLSKTRSLLEQHDEWFRIRRDYRLFVPLAHDGTFRWGDSIVKVAVRAYLYERLERIWLDQDEVELLGFVEARKEYRRRWKRETERGILQQAVLHALRRLTLED